MKKGCGADFGSVENAIDGEIKMLRDRLDDDTSPAVEMQLRARISGLEWALSEVLRGQVESSTS